jgi:hypothetical protein
MTLQEWRELPPMLKATDLARIYPYSVSYIKKLWQQRSPKVPPPCIAKPYACRREDARRHFEHLTL